MLAGGIYQRWVPPTLCAYLSVIDLHSNRLFGRIPYQLGLPVRLSSFDVSYNQLEGPIPVMLANRNNVGAGAGAGGRVDPKLMRARS